MQRYITESKLPSYNDIAAILPYNISERNMVLTKLL